MHTKFTDQQLSQIIDQSLIFQCACPAQVAKYLIEIRDLYAYQQSCLNQTDIDRAVHERIASDALKAHNILEGCLEAVLVLEEWNMETLQMPSHLQKAPRVV